MDYRPGSSYGRNVLCHFGLAIWLLAVQVHAQAPQPGYRAFPLKNVNASEVAPRLRENLASMGVRAQIFVDPQENQLLIRGTEETLRLAVQLVQTMDQPVAASVPSSRATEVVGYRVETGDLSAVAAQLQQQFPLSGGTRMVIDERARQLIVVATPEVHREIAKRLQNLPPRGPSEMPAAQASVANAYQLQRLNWREFEEGLQRLWGGRLTITGSANGEQANVTVPGADGPIPVMQIDRTNGRISFLGDGQSVATWHGFVQGMDDIRTQGGTVTQLVSLKNAEPEKVRMAVSLMNASAPKKAGEVTTAVPIARAGARRRTASDLVSLVFQAPAAQPPPAAVPVPVPVPVPGAAPGEQPEAPAGDDEGGGLRGPVQIDIFLDTLIIRGDKRDVERVRRIIAEIEKIAETTKPVIEVYHLQYVNSEAIATLIADPTSGLYNEILAQRQGQVSIRALVQPNALLLIGRQESVDEVKKLILKLDQPTPPSSRFEVIRIINVSATDMETLIRNFFATQAAAGAAGAAAAGTRTGLGTRVQIVSDYRTNSLIVQASPRDLEEVRRLIQSLDVDTPGGQSELRIIRLKNAVAQTLATVLQAAIAGQPTTTTGQLGVAPTAQPGAAGTGASQTSRPSTALEMMIIDQNTGRLVRGGILTDVIVTADSTTNSLIVRAPARSMELVVALVAQLDKLPDVDSQIKVFQIINGDATSLAGMLQQLFGLQQTAGQGLQGGAFGVGGLGNFNQQVQAATAGGETSLVQLRFVVDLRTNSIIATGSEADLNVVWGIITRLDQTINDRRLSVVRLRNTQASAVATAIQTYLTNQQTRIQQQLLTQGVISPFDSVEREVFIVSENVTNSLIVSASPRYYDQIMGVIRELDIRPPMVLVQVLIAEVRLDDFFEFGSELGLQDSLVFDRGKAQTPFGPVAAPAGGGTNPVSIPGFNFGQYTPVNQSSYGQGALAGQSLTNFALGRSNTAFGYGGLVLSAANESINILIRALQDEQRLQILSRPQVMTMHNQPAYVQVGADVARINGTTVNNNNVTLDVQDRATGIILSILPLINDDGVVVLGVEAERSAVGSDADGTTIGTDNNGNPIVVPPVNVTRASTTVSAMDGQTVVFAGLITKTRQLGLRRVPYLSDVPILGRLFEHEQNTEQRTELLIVMTPYVIRSDADAEMAKLRESERMSWCLSDVISVGCDWGLMGGGCMFCENHPTTIYPDLDPSGSAHAMAAKEGPSHAEQHSSRRENVLVPVPVSNSEGYGTNYDVPPPVTDTSRFQRVPVPNDQQLLPANGTMGPGPTPNGVSPARFQPTAVRRLPSVGTRQ